MVHKSKFGGFCGKIIKNIDKGKKAVYNDFRQFKMV